MNRKWIIVGIVALIVVVGATFVWHQTGDIEIPQEVTLGAQKAPRQEYQIVWPVGHHYKMILGDRKKPGHACAGKVTISQGDTELFEKSFGEHGLVVTTRCPQVPGEVALKAGGSYTITVDLTKHGQLDGLELYLVWLKDYRDIRSER